MNTIIFDIGRVLLNFDPRSYLSKKYDEQTVDLILSELFLTDQWHQLDRGDFSDTEMMKGICSRHPDEADLFRAVYDDWVDMLEPIEENVQVVKELKEKGYTLLLLSNFSETGFQKVFNQYDFFRMFDGGVISYEARSCKPEKMIYEQLIFQYGLNPDDCLFIDDLGANIDAANALGIKGIWFNNGVNLMNEMKKKNIL